MKSGKITASKAINAGFAEAKKEQKQNAPKKIAKDRRQNLREGFLQGHISALELYRRNPKEFESKMESIILRQENLLKGI